MNCILKVATVCFTLVETYSVLISSMWACHHTAFDVWLDDHRDIWNELVLKLLVWGSRESKAFWQTWTSNNTATFSKSFLTCNWLMIFRLTLPWCFPTDFPAVLPYKSPSFLSKEWVNGICWKNHKELFPFKRRSQILKHQKSEWMDLLLKKLWCLLFCVPLVSLLCWPPMPS